MKRKTDISQIRFKYKKKPFDVKNSDSNPFNQFSKWLKEAIRNKIFESTAMTLSTANKRKVSSRVVLLKGIENNRFVFYTNLNSRKSKELKNNKNVAAVFWWPQLGKQVRIEGYVKLVDKKRADYYFSTRSRKSQIGAWASNQSSILKDRKILLNKFEIIKKRFANKDVLRPNFWSGYEITPFLIEFWQGRENRLHDRIVYKKVGQKKWKKYRLNP
jgi:pyridoxamine 5'-phosphate oxidase